jgi:DNA repair photolyase
MKKLIELSTMVRTGFGTGEWSETSRNCMIGCEHDCAYCYSRANAINKGEIADRAAWPIENADEKAIAKRHYTFDGLVMAFTRHDITPANIKYTLPYLRGELEVGNYVLLVTKAHLNCIKLICQELADYKEQLLIRVTIGSMNPLLCKFWERNAPHPHERLAALQCAMDSGFENSASMEPMLHGVEDAVATYKLLEPFVTERVWIGAMNSLDSRVDMTNPNFKEAVADIKVLQSKSELLRLYNLLKDEPKILWKKSIKDAVGLK